MIDIFITVYVLIAMYFFYDLASSRKTNDIVNFGYDALAAILWMPIFGYHILNLLRGK